MLIAVSTDGRHNSCQKMKPRQHYRKAGSMMSTVKPGEEVNNINAEVGITNAVAIKRDYIYLSSSLNSMPVYSPHTRLSQYDEQYEFTWSKHDVEWWSVSLAIYTESENSDSELCAMSNEGHIEFIGDHEPIMEKIPGAGVFTEDAKGWGYMSSIRQIGEHLYAGGDGGQVYKRVAPHHWEHMDDGILQAPDVENRFLLADIQGAMEDDIYICGGIPGSHGLEGRLYHWNGKHWINLPLPTSERLTAFHLEDAATMWICGVNGTLLCGNNKDGFKDLSMVDDNQLFTSISKFNGRIYLASNMGLFCFDGKTINEVNTGLTPELHDANVIDAVDGVLWSIGIRDIARFDGVTWERIDHPDNPPIR